MIYIHSYLWRFFDYKLSSDEHVLSIIYFINEKFNQQISVWDILINTTYFDDEDNKDEPTDWKAQNMQKLGLLFKRIFEMKLLEIDAYLHEHEHGHKSQSRSQYLRI